MNLDRLDFFLKEVLLIDTTLSLAFKLQSHHISVNGTQNHSNYYRIAIGDIEKMRKQGFRRAGG